MTKSEILDDERKRRSPRSGLRGKERRDVRESEHKEDDSIDVVPQKDLIFRSRGDTKNVVVIPDKSFDNTMRWPVGKVVRSANNEPIIQHVARKGRRRGRGRKIDGITKETTKETTKVIV